MLLDVPPFFQRSNIAARTSGSNSEMRCCQYLTALEGRIYRLYRIEGRINLKIYVDFKIEKKHLNI